MPFLPARREGTPPSPIGHTRPGAYVLTTDTTAQANPGAAIGFTSVPPGTPNPSNQQTTGQVIGGLTRANALALAYPGSAISVYYLLGALPPYFGYADIRFFEEEVSVGDVFPEVVRLVVTNGRTAPVPSSQPALVAMLNSLTWLAAPAQGVPPEAASLGMPAQDPLTGQYPNGLRVWLPPGQNDLWLAANYFDPAEAAIVWYTVTAAPATEAAIAPQS